ncbi:MULTISPECIES: hypothetical protein [unclassified Streptomyces]|uniref:hypothetical protein n=1 Tax=unclassified Streptomyces TaxID=2593676 RepID=UPI00380FF9C5
MRLWKPFALAAATVAASASVLAAPAFAANGQGDKYTHSTTLSQPSCFIHANYPKAGIADWGWTKPQRSPKGGSYHVGVRYTYRGYALVKDYGAAGEPSWGFVATSCLTDPHAYDTHHRQLPDRRAVGGSGAVKSVAMSAPHAGKSKRGLVHVGTGQVGTLRDAGKSFAIGNVRAGDAFYLTTEHCGKHNTRAWILGYAPASGRWGFVQAAHLPACH